MNYQRGLIVMYWWHRLHMQRAITVVMWMIALVHVAANVEAWYLRHKAGLPFRFLP